MHVFLRWSTWNLKNKTKLALHPAGVSGSEHDIGGNIVSG